MSASALSKAKPDKKLLIMGAGGLARELANAVAQLNSICPAFEVLGYLDDKQELHGQEFLDLPVLGTVELLSHSE